MTLPFFLIRLNLKVTIHMRLGILNLWENLKLTKILALIQKNPVDNQARLGYLNLTRLLFFCLHMLG